jgi:hypothetical protein
MAESCPTNAISASGYDKVRLKQKADVAILRDAWTSKEGQKSSDKFAMHTTIIAAQEQLNRYI